MGPTRAQRVEWRAMGIKWCPQCSAPLAVACFGKDASSGDGLRGECAECVRARAHSERTRAYMAAWYQANSERQRAVRREWWKANAEKMKAKRVVWYQANTEKVKASCAAWRKANPEKVRLMRRKSKARRRGAVAVGDVDRAVVWERDAGRCHLCGKKADQSDWHLDHIVAIAAGGEHPYANVAVSHPACNMSKGARGPGQLRMWGTLERAA